MLKSAAHQGATLIRRIDRSHCGCGPDLNCQRQFTFYTVKGNNSPWKPYLSALRAKKAY
jgi:hypothetical protein